MRIVHISDLHFTRLSIHPLRLFSKRFVGLCNWIFLRKGEMDHAPLESLPQLWHSLGVEQILVAGDLTTTSLKSEFLAAREFFDQFEQPKLFIPGNHDHYTRGAYRQKRFYRFFTNPPTEQFYLNVHGVEAHRIGSWGWCVVLDTAIPTCISCSHGLFSPQVEANLDALLKSLPPDEPILLMNHFPFFQNDSPAHRLVRGEQLRMLLEKYPNIRLYLHGHTHRHTIADLQSNRLPLILDSGCPVQKSQATWNLLDLSDQGCVVQAYQWKNTAWEPFRKESILWRTDNA